MPNQDLPEAPTKAKGLLALAEQQKGRALTDFGAGDWVAEPKMDGWRLAVNVDAAGEAHLFTRSAREVTAHVPWLAEVAAAHLPAGTWLDGEAVFVGENGIEWGSVQSALGGNPGAREVTDRVSFVAFDLIAYDGMDARPLPYDGRRALLERVVGAVPDGRVSVPTQLVPGGAALEWALAHGYEGLVIKRRAAAYRAGRGPAWVKVKPVETEEFVVMGFKPGQNSFKGLVGALVLGRFHSDDGENFTMVEEARASGMDMTTRRHMTENPAEWIGKVVEVAHMGLMPSGGYRHPQFKRLRKDRDALEVVA